MATLLWIDTEWDEAINLGDPFRLWEIFAELLRSGVDEEEMPDLFQVVEVAESQEDCDLDWLERVQNQAAKFLRLHGHNLSPAAKETLELLRKGEGETKRKSLSNYRTKSVSERPEDVKTKPRPLEHPPQNDPPPVQVKPSPEAKTKKRDIGEAPKLPEIKPKAEFGIKPEPPKIKPSLGEEKKEKLESGDTPTKVIKQPEKSAKPERRPQEGDPKKIPHSINVNRIVSSEIEEYEKLGMSPNDINCGDCHKFSQNIVNRIRELGADVVYGVPNVGPTHIWVIVNGKHYDAQHPNGVDDPSELTFFQDNPDVIEDGWKESKDDPLKPKEAEESKQEHPPAELRKEESQPVKFRDPRGDEVKSKDVDDLPLIPDYAKCPVIEDRSEENDRRRQLTKTYLSQPATRKVSLGGKTLNQTFRLIFGDVDKGEPVSMAIFKPRFGEKRARDGVEEGTYYRREVAASLIAQLLGLGSLVPHTAFRAADTSKYMTDIGSAAEWVSNATGGYKLLDSIRFGNTKSVSQGAVFDYLICNMDRHHGNFMLSPSSEIGKPMNMVLIDHGLTLPFEFGGDEFQQMSGDNALIFRTIQKNLPMPDVSSWRGKMKQLGAILTWCGIESKAIEMTLKRLHAITSPRYNTIAKLPSPMGHKETLGDIYKSSF